MTNKFKIGDIVTHSKYFLGYKLKIVGVNNLYHDICFLDLRKIKNPEERVLITKNDIDLYDMPKDWVGTQQNIFAAWLLDLALYQKCEYCYAK